MGNVAATRRKVSKRQSVKLTEAQRLCKAMCDHHDPKDGKGSHSFYAIGTDKLQLSHPKGDQLLPYQLKDIDDWLTRNGK